MVGSTDLAQAGALWGRYQDYQNALKIYDHNPHISAFILESEAVEDATQRSVTVPAEGITSPPQMLTAIRSQIEARMADISRQLAELGVTV